jgi:hypothetical protein
MPFTGESIHGWRVAKNVEGRRPLHGVGFVAHVDEPVVELVKGHNHIRGQAQEGIDPQLVLGRCVTAALTEDLRVADEAGDYDVAFVLANTLERQKRAQKVKEVAAAVQRVERRIANALLYRAIQRRDMPPGTLLVGPATQKGTISGTEDDQRVVAYREQAKKR